MNNAWLLLIVLACPVAMCTMMFFMMRGHNKKGNKSSNDEQKSE